MKNIYYLGLGLGLLLSTQANADFIGKVVKISDGDTITVLDSSNRQQRVRFNQIDAPESSQAYGQRSRQNISFIHNQNVYVDEDSKDKYGRTLGTVYLMKDGQTTNLHFRNSVNYKQIKDGYAWVYRQYAKDKTLIADETAARIAKRGLWADPNPVPPWEYRRSK
jgi:endonuclease YncB( thermonuclease family)